MRSFIVSALVALSFASVADAKVCRDGRHHVVRCPTPHVVVHRCRDAHGHDMACRR
jgi:hypothetical protein